MKDYLEKIHEHSKNNRTEIEKSDTCGCFYCREMFVSSEIKNWIKENKGGTALCPFCHIDAIIGDAGGFALNKNLLEQLYFKYFNK